MKKNSGAAGSFNIFQQETLMDFTIEELSMDAWPALMTFPYDGWIIRLANGYGNRSNSINPIYPSRIALEEKIEYCDTLFARYGLPATYKLLGCEEHEPLEKKLEGLGYRKINETSLQVCEIPASLKTDNDGIIVNDGFSGQWIESVVKFNRIEEKHVPIFKRILDNIAGEKIVVHKRQGKEILGCGYGIIGRGYVGVFDIVVDENHRGKGFGREIVQTILSEGLKRGVRNSYLQVMLNNPIALGLYGKLGYREIYRYWYRKKSETLSSLDNV